MPTETKWLIEGKVIFQRMWGDITIEDIEEMSKISKQLIESSDRHLVHTITDNSEVKSSPPSNKVRNASKEALQHPRFGWFVIYGQNDRLQRFFFQLATSIFNLRTRWFNTREESLNFLAKVDSQLEADIMQLQAKQ